MVAAHGPARGRGHRIRLTGRLVRRPCRSRPPRRGPARDTTRDEHDDRGPEGHRRSAPDGTGAALSASTAVPTGGSHGCTAVTTTTSAATTNDHPTRVISGRAIEQTDPAPVTAAARWASSPARSAGTGNPDGLTTPGTRTTSRASTTLTASATRAVATVTGPGPPAAATVTLARDRVLRVRRDQPDPGGDRVEREHGGGPGPRGGDVVPGQQHPGEEDEHDHRHEHPLCGEQLDQQVARHREDPTSVHDRTERTEQPSSRAALSHASASPASTRACRVRSRQVTSRAAGSAVAVDPAGPGHRSTTSTAAIATGPVGASPGSRRPPTRRCTVGGAETRGATGVVGQQDRRPLRDRVQTAREGVGRRVVERGPGLVEHEQAGVGGQGLGEPDLLRVAARQVRHRAGERPGEAELLEHVLRAPGGPVDRAEVPQVGPDRESGGGGRRRAGTRPPGPDRRTRPRDGAEQPAAIRSSVDLPEPFAPSTTEAVPGSTARSTPARTSPALR